MNYKVPIIGAVMGAVLSVPIVSYFSDSNLIDAVGRSIFGNYPFPYLIQGAAVGTLLGLVTSSRIGGFDLETKIETKD